VLALCKSKKLSPSDWRPDCPAFAIVSSEFFRDLPAKIFPHLIYGFALRPGRRIEGPITVRASPRGDGLKFDPD
jgi:hypothetical protein